MNNFLQDESGAVTVDWVVITSGVVGLGLATMTVVSGGVETASGNASGTMTGFEISSSFEPLSSIENWLANYSPVNSALHGPSWGPDAQGRSWVENTYDNWSQLSDHQIQHMYTSDYASAILGDATRADYVAVQEQIMAERGIAIPSGNLSAADIAATF
jgi:Flp pilus assembly pilin Flp